MTRILIVDDDPDVLWVTELGLRLGGFETHSAASGAEALEALAAHAFDAVLTDMVMPEMGGDELVARAHERWPELPMMVLTGLPEAQVRELLAGFPDVAITFKPMAPQELGTFVRRALGLPEGAG